MSGWAFLLVAGLSARGLEPLAGRPLVEEAALAFTQSVASARTVSDTLRVGFYNIEMFTDGIKDGKKRNEDLARNQAKGAGPIIDALSADVLLLSEVENGRVLQWINESLETPYPAGYIVQFGSGSGRIEKMNLGLLSRVPVSSVHEIDFGPMTGAHRPTRGLLRVVVPLDGDRHLLIYAAHLKANWGDRARNFAQRVAAMEKVKEDVANMTARFPDRRWEMMVIGDFNTDPLLSDFEDDPTLRVLEDWTDLFSQHPDISDLHTVPTRRGDPMREFPPALFDRVLVDASLMDKPWQASLPGVIMKGTETGDITVRPGEGRHVSDHYPIYLDLLR